MSHPLGADGVVELAVLERSGLVESRHLDAAVLTDRDGAPQRELGDTESIVFPRSSLKPFQALAVRRAGVRLDGAELALTAASHGGTPRHIGVVGRILEGGGLTADALECPADWPRDSASRDAVVLLGDHRRPIYMNCSGKHAGFLRAAEANGWSLEGYLDAEHPLQQRIREVVGEYTGEPIGASGVDGCGAPVHAVSLRGMARAMSLFVRGLNGAGEPDADAAAITAAMLAEPWAVEGPGTPNTVVIEQLGIVAKGGAEGYLLVGAPTGEAVALKLLDGSVRATTVVALTLLAQAGVIDADAAARAGAEATPDVTGGDAVVGQLRAAI